MPNIGQVSRLSKLLDFGLKLRNRHFLKELRKVRLSKSFFWKLMKKSKRVGDSDVGLIPRGLLKLGEYVFGFIEVTITFQASTFPPAYLEPAS